MTVEELKTYLDKLDPDLEVFVEKHIEGFFRPFLVEGVRLVALSESEAKRPMVLVPKAGDDLGILLETSMVEEWYEEV